MIALRALYVFIGLLLIWQAVIVIFAPPHFMLPSPLVTADSLPFPRYLYASTKVFLESLGRVFARRHGLAAVGIPRRVAVADAKRKDQRR